MARGKWIGTGVALVIVAGATTWYASRTELGLQPDGSYLVPSGQTLTPVGKMVKTVFARPKDIAVSPDGQTVAVLATDGVHFYNLDGEESFKAGFGGAALGIAWAPDGSTVYASQNNGFVARLERTDDGKWARTQINIDLEGKSGNPQGNGLAISSDGSKLYVALGIRNALVEYDLEASTVSRVVETDVAPYHVLLDGSSLYVACRGGIEASPDRIFAADAAGTRVRVDPLTDAAAMGTVLRIDLGSFAAERIASGRQPGAMAVANGGLYIAMSDSDMVTFVGPDRIEHASMRPPDDAHFGQMPTGLAISDDGTKMYVALGGANAVAVCDITDGIKIEGYFPTAWFPIDVALVGDQIIVPCAKGIGARTEITSVGSVTRHGIKFQEDLYYIHNNVGTVHFVGLDQIRNIDRMTEMVASNNSWAKELAPRKGIDPVPIPARVGEPSVFKHVVYVIKENLTYDSVLGDMREGKGRADLCMFPEMVSPNHHEISRNFVLLDNTYVSGTNSADGHMWTSSSIANAYMEHSYSAYARSYPYDGDDPLAYSPEGFLWNAAIKSGLSVRVFGEFVDQPSIKHKETGRSGTFKEIWADYKSGEGMYVIEAHTTLKALEPVLHPNYIGFPSNVSDQWRVDQFEADLAMWEAAGEMPSLIVMLIPNDHTQGFTPDYPTPWAAVADNDLALGRIVEMLSNSSFWPETLILGIQDDAQLGIDHVDGHRTFAFVASPYTKRGETISTMYNTTSFIRTIGLVLGMPAMTRFDRAAHPLLECFTSTPDFTPYTKRPNRVPLDQYTQRPEKQTDLLARELTLKSMQLDWSEVDEADADIVAQAAWHFAFPERDFPWEFFDPRPDLDDPEENRRVAEGQSSAKK
ncbi:MAG: hypothetical protein IH944_11855 [Armatimonadetes bacterium]|nr:hypothetical protein [Armatimonadota bacterium]